ncbi:hypothetical protein MTO96_037665 [Rhipicephalus appendiculatus]|uniref:Basic tail secreted protein n=1 Tax=Rhipicephalus appendiculatus TaxID=34631 RepID=A0A131YEC4_RHIAP
MENFLHSLCSSMLIVISISGGCCTAYNYGYGNNVCRGGRYPVRWNPCIYLCINNNVGRYRNYPDGTQCFFIVNRRTVSGRCFEGQCYRGATRPPPKKHCNHPYKGKGYAPNCQYPCPDDKRRTGSYPSGTPCIKVNSDGKREGAPGVCRNGDCITFELLGNTFATWKAT